MSKEGSTFREERLAGWGNLPRQLCQVADPRDNQQLRRTLDSESASIAPRGMGRAYGDSALHEKVVRTTSCNRFLSFNTATGVIRCQAGVTLEDIINAALPHGWFLPTTPGTKFVTVGGAVAADVHGKNHHRDGSFGNFVRHLTLATANSASLNCSPRSRSDVFWATIGGMGLTGFILTVELQLRKVESAFCRVRYLKTTCLDQTLETFAETNDKYEHSVAWIDCLSQGESLGRSIVMLGNDASREDLPTTNWHAPLAIPRRRKKTIPFYFPSFALNRWTVRRFNNWYYSRHREAEKLVDFDRFFYPLDSVNHWNRMYGRRGFAQYQALFPHKTSRKGLVALLERVAKSGQASFLAVLKSSGAANQGLLSFMHPGHTIALDLPNTGEPLKRLIADLDEIVLEHEGRLYLAKDAFMTAETFASMYPRLARFQAIKAELDPENSFVTAQARRIGIV